MLYIILNAYQEVQKLAVPSTLRPFWPHRLFYPRPFDFRPIPSELGFVTKFIYWKGPSNEASLPFVKVLLELDVDSFVLGGSAVLIYSLFSGDVSFGFYNTWPPPSSFVESIIPIDRTWSYVGARGGFLIRYMLRFTAGGLYYICVKKTVFDLLPDNVIFTPFRKTFLAALIYSWSWVKSYSFQHRTWKVINTFWTALGLAYGERLVSILRQSVSNLPDTTTA